MFSQRERSFGASLYRLRDRRARELFLPPTCEEAAAWLTSTGLRSHKELPLMFYQIGSKFRDEPRPRAGCLRAREFFMLEAYSFHQNESCRERTYHMMDECFRRIFARVGVAPIYRVLADSGAMGGPCSHEYHVSPGPSVLQPQPCIRRYCPWQTEYNPPVIQQRPRDQISSRVAFERLNVGFRFKACLEKIIHFPH